jgi:phosphohistidine phosphatase
MRHAKSSWAHDELADIDRPLNKRGLRDAPLMGKKLINLAGMPDRILCSPARRTRETLQALQLTTSDTHYEPEIYESYGSTLLDLIARQPDTINNLLLIGHNPSISQLASRLAGSFLGDLPTCALVQLHLKTRSWQKISSAPAQLINHEYPKKQF